MPHIDTLVTTTEAAEIISRRNGISYKAVNIKKLCQTGSIQGAQKIGERRGQWFVPTEWAETYVPRGVKNRKNTAFKIVDRDFLYPQIIDCWRRLSPEKAMDYLRGQDIIYAYHSGTIDNPEITYQATESIFKRNYVESYTGSLTTLLEIRNAWRASLFFHNSLVRQRPLESEFVIELYRILMQDCCEINTMILAAAGLKIKSVLIELESYKIEHTAMLQQAAFFHAQFFKLCPFVDGNGRAGRLAMNYLLALHGHPIITIHKDGLECYYDALKSWDLRRDLKALQNFLRYQTCRTWDKLLDE